MDNKKLFQIWLSIATLAIAYYFIYRFINKKKYYDFIHNLGFGDTWLDMLNFQELKDLYTYIHDYTQQGKTVTLGSSLDLRLIALSKKVPQLLQYS